VKHGTGSGTLARERDALRTTVNVERIVDCPFSFAVNEAGVILALVQGPRGGSVRLPYRELGLPFGGAATHRVDVGFRRQRDQTEPGRVHDEIAFHWSARSRWLPNFHGVLRFRIESMKTRMILGGAYHPPFGLIGVAFDRLIGHRLALATSRDLADRLAQALETRWAAEKQA